MQVIVYRSIWDEESNKVWLGDWAEKPRQDYNSPEDMPPWLQERWAVVRLLDSHMGCPLGEWAMYEQSEPEHAVFFYVPQPGDPKLGGE